MIVTATIVQNEILFKPQTVFFEELLELEDDFELDVFELDDFVFFLDITPS